MDDFCSEDRLPTLAYRLGEEETPAPSPEEESSQADTSPTGSSAQARVEKPPLIAGYEIELPALGQGGMGIVYRGPPCEIESARRPENPAPLRPRAAMLGGSCEAELAARLQHAHIVQVYEVGAYRDREDGPERPYIAFELIQGGGLNVLLRETVLPPRQAAALVETLARTMQAVHDRGIVHRDLKPANVLLAPVGQAASLSRDAEGQAGSLSYVPKITDFGLACLLEDFDSSLTRTGQLLGTPGYMAPEQIDGKRREIGPAADIHALGAILYECLTGRPPFKGTSIRETLDLVCGQEPAPIRRLRPDVPRDLETICLKCLHKDPARRYQRSADLADDLRRFQQGRPILARPVSCLERAITWCRRQPLLAALIAACLLLVASLLAVGTSSAYRLAKARTLAATAEAEAAAAREVAATQEYFSLLHTARRGASDLEPGWTSKGLSALQRAATLPTRVVDREELRGEAANHLTGIDLQPGRTFSVGFTASRLAFHPHRSLRSGGQPLLAVGEAKGWLTCSVVLIDFRTGKTTHRLSLSSARCWNKSRLVQDGITALAFSPDGRWLLAGTRSGQLHRWDLTKADARAKSWAAHKERVCQVLFGNAADIAFSASSDRTVKRWSIRESEKCTHQLLAYGCITQGPILESLLVTDEHQVHVVAQSDLRPLRKPLPLDGHLARFAGQGPVLLASGNSLSLLDGESGRITQTLRHPGREEAHERAISDLRASADGMLLASSSEQARQVRLWETASGRLLANLPVLDGVAQIDFSPTGHTLAVLSGREVHLHEVGGFSVEHFAGLHAWPVLACAFGKNGDLACVSGDRRNQQGELAFWSGPRVWRRSLGLPEPRLPVRLHADPKGEWLAHTEGAGLGISSVARPGQRTVLSPGEVHSLAFEADSGLWLAVGKSVEKRTLPDGRPSLAWENSLGDLITGLGNVWAVAPGRRHVLAGGRDGCLRLLDARTGKLLNNWKICSSPILSVALSADEQLGLVGTWKGGVCLVRLPSGEKVRLPEKHRDRVESVVFLGADLFASGSADHTLRLWHLDRGIARAWLTLNKKSGVKSLSASANGERLAVLLCGERAVRILDLGRLRARLAKLGLE